MIETSNLFVQGIAESSRQLKAQLLKGNAAISGTIRNITINKGACGEDLFSIGSVYSSYIEVVMDECEEKLENEELLLQIGLVIGDSVEYVNVGYYTVTKPKNTAYQTTFTAVGRITAKMNCLPNNMPATPTLANLASAITETTGVAIICKGVTLAGTIEEDLTGYTCREILEVIVSVLGGFATEDSAGNIVISKFSTENPIAYNGDRTVTLPEFNDYDYVLSGVKVIKTEEWTDEDDTVHAEISYTEGTPRQTLSNKFMTAGLFSAFTDNVIGFTYRPGNIPLALGDPRLEPWDCIAFTDVNGNVYTVPCLNIVHTFDGGLSTMITAPGESESESETQTKGPIIQQLERMAAQLFTAEQAILKRLTVDQADIKYANIQTLNAAVGRIDSLSGDFLAFKEAEFNSLKANVAKIDMAYITEADVENIVADKGYFTEAEVEELVAGKGYITELQTKTLLSNYVKAETLEADYIKASEISSKYATIENLNATNASIATLTAKAITTDNLAAKVGDFGYITAEEVKANYVSTQTLEADYITAEEIDSDYIKASELEATVGDFGFLKANSAELTSLLVDKVDIDLGNIDTLWVEDLMIKGNFVTNDVNAATGSFTKWLTGVKIYGDLITAGTISTERLIIRDANNNTGILYEINNGIVTQENLTPEELKRLTLDGKVITAESITADKINVTDLFAQDITATGTISGAKLYGTYIETISGSIGGFNICGSYIASANTTQLGSTANSVYLGLDGISLGTDFKVTAAGKMTATGAEITGTLNRTKITSDGMEILDASGNTVAQYGATTIGLGVKATDATINLCGGLGSIKAATHDDNTLSALGINANILKLNATGTVGYLSLNVAQTNGYTGSFTLYGAGSDAYANLKLSDSVTYSFRTSRFTVPVQIQANDIYSETDVQVARDLYVGGDIYGYKFWGNADRPTYQGKGIALLSDITAAVGGNYLPLRGALGDFTNGNVNNNVSSGLYTLVNSTLTNLPASGIYGAFFQLPGEYRPQMVIGGTDGVGTIYVRRYLTSSSSWTAWTKMATTADLAGYALAGHTHSYLPLSGGTLSGDLNFSNASAWITPYLLAFKNADTSASPTYPYTGFYQWGNEWQVNARDANNNWVKNVMAINLVSGVANFLARPTVNGSQIALMSDITTSTGRSYVLETVAQTSSPRIYLVDDDGDRTSVQFIAGSNIAISSSDNNTITIAATGLAAAGHTHSNYVTTNTAQTITGIKTFNAPTDVSGSETITAKFKTSNGGAIIFGKEGPNSGTMIRLDQADGTCRLRFRSSDSAGAIVWDQPEQGAMLYIDLGKEGVDKHRITFPTSAGTLATTAYVDSKVSSSGLPYRLQASQSTDSLGNPNSATETGFYYINSTTNRPSFSQSGNNDYRILTTAYSSQWLQQIATDFRCDDIFYRRCQNGTWQSWKKIAFSDHTHSDYAAASHTHPGYALTASGNTFNGEQKFVNSSYCPTVTDTAPGIGCAFKASRGLFNDALIDSIVMTGTTNQTLEFYIYSSTSNGSPANMSRVAYIDENGVYYGTANKATCDGVGNAITTTYATKAQLSGYATTSHTHNSITYTDTRSTNQTPNQVPQGLSVHLKSNSTDGISDGGNYHPILQLKPWGDISGGPYGQITTTQNGNLYWRVSTANNGESWNGWNRAVRATELSSYLPKSGGALTGSLTFANGTMNTVGDDVQIGDQNIAGTLCVKGANGTTSIKLMEYNSNNEVATTIMLNAVSTYGGLRVTGGKGGYHGILLGDDNKGLNIMSSEPHQGLYNESRGKWLFYYHREYDQIGINCAPTSIHNFDIDIFGETRIQGALHVSGAVSAAGGISVGTQASMDTNGYVTGTWLRTMNTGNLGSANHNICVLSNGWIYYRTPAEICSDIGAAPSSHTHNYAAIGHTHEFMTAYGGAAYNVDTCYDAGLYMVQAGSNCPSGSQYGSLLTLPYRKRTGNTTQDFGVQIYLPNGDDSTKANSMFYRTSLSGSWNAWQEVATKADVQSAVAGGHDHPRLYNGDGVGFVNITLSGGAYYFKPGEGHNTRTVYCGGTNYRWQTVYSVNALNTSSDLKFKTDISNNLDAYVRMMDIIEPITFVRTNSPEDKRHVGYGAQYVESALATVGLANDDFAGLSKEWDEENGYYSYGLTYEEFIPILHARQNRDRIEFDERLKSLGGEVQTIHMKYDAALMKIAELEKRIDQLKLAS